MEWKVALMLRTPHLETLIKVEKIYIKNGYISRKMKSLVTDYHATFFINWNMYNSTIQY